jgi:hypothetical protein
VRQLRHTVSPDSGAAVVAVMVQALEGVRLSDPIFAESTTLVDVTVQASVSAFFRSPHTRMFPCCKPTQCRKRPPVVSSGQNITKAVPSGIGPVFDPRLPAIVFREIRRDQVNDSYRQVHRGDENLPWVWGQRCMRHRHRDVSSAD